MCQEAQMRWRGAAFDHFRIPSLDYRCWRGPRGQGHGRAQPGRRTRSAARPAAWSLLPPAAPAPRCWASCARVSILNGSPTCLTSLTRLTRLSYSVPRNSCRAAACSCGCLRCWASSVQMRVQGLGHWPVQVALYNFLRIASPLHVPICLVVVLHCSTGPTRPGITASLKIGQGQQ